MFTLCLLALALAASVAVGLAKRIVAPLGAVSMGAQRIAEGDLSARAVAPLQHLGAASDLVENFNLMAERLETSASGVARWNSIIAHELRTPVTILRGRIQGMADGVFEPEPHLLNSCLSQIDGLARLVEDLRTVSLVESGHLDWRPELVSVHEEIAAVISLALPDFGEKGFVIHADLDEGFAVVDPGRIRQGLLALLENARKYAVPGRLDVALRMTPEEVMLSVEDAGPGLPEGFADEAFQPFRRGQNHNRSRGSGLGLAVVAGIAKAHGGVARYAGVAGRGRFEIVFPRVT